MKTHPTIYLIRHGEKDKVNGKDEQGLNTAGLTRAKELVGVFGSSSTYKIGYIMAEKREDDGDRARPYATVEPLAQSLGLTIDEIAKNHTDKAADNAKGWKGRGDVLICWEHGVLSEILGKIIGDDNPPEYPDKEFGVIWTVAPPYNSYSTSHEAGTAP